MSINNSEVPAENLHTVCDPDSLAFETTDGVAQLEGTVGEERALSALELAVDIDADGYNFFVSGIPGSGTNTALRSYLQKAASDKPNPPDSGYVYNFEDPSQPLAISMSCGMIRQLAHDMDDLTSSCRHEIPRAFDTEEYSYRVEEMMQGVQEKHQALTTTLEQEAQQRGFTLTQEEFAKLADDVRDNFRGRADELQHEIAQLAREMRRLNKGADEKVSEIDSKVVRVTLSPIIDELQEKYADFPQVADYLT